MLDTSCANVSGVVVALLATLAEDGAGDTDADEEEEEEGEEDPVCGLGGALSAALWRSSMS